MSLQQEHSMRVFYAMNLGLGFSQVCVCVFGGGVAREQNN